MSTAPDSTAGTVTLIISGGIAAYKSLILIRRLREQGVTVRPVLTKAAQQFVTPLSVSALAEHPVYSDLFDLTAESEMGHIRLSRESDLILIAPASADLMGKAALGLADDLASSVLLASDKPLAVAPSMNPMMWQHPATQQNLHTLKDRGAIILGPDDGDMACGETGSGRMREPEALAQDVMALLAATTGTGPLAGKRAIVTSGPTHEPIDPVRYIANRSSGRQGHAIAGALAAAGAEVTLVSGPVSIPAPPGVQLVSVETARQMQTAVTAALPADIAVCAAAVADWRVAGEGAQKLKKTAGAATPVLNTVENPDILAGLCASDQRPDLVIGFAAETESLEANAVAKRGRKGCDWLVANDVSPENSIFGGSENDVLLVTDDGTENWPRMSKSAVADRLVAKITGQFTE